MHYYDILLADYRYRGDGFLTYCSESELPERAIVTVPVRQQSALGVVIKKVSQPAGISVKPIQRVVLEAPLPAWTLDIMTWLSSYYPSSLGQAGQLLLPRSLLQHKPAKQTSLPSRDELPKELTPALTKEQAAAVTQIQAADQNSVLLHGVTGSGKTRVYLELIQASLQLGKSVIVLTPEIGLTPQLKNELERHYGNRVLVAHSNITPAKRRAIWLHALQSTEPLIMIGPRSALFYPFKQVGVIVVDEAHDNSYKQEQAPHYSAARVAAKLAQLHHCKLVLGTATPTIVDYFTFSSKHLPIIRMEQQALTNKAADLTAQTIDTSERAQFSRSPWLANTLLDAIKYATDNNEQSLIYLNRRGTARFVSCQQCGWQATCQHCDMNLIYHGDKHVLRCHVCGITQAPPLTCPECSHTEIVFRSAGTKMIVDELQRLFPGARIVRFDSDNPAATSLETLYQELHDGTVDIAVGTQVIGKGLDLPRLAVIGILQADNALLLPDYLSEEELFQGLYQLLGRAGRGHRHGQAFIQTQQPDHPVVRAAINKDYAGFYQAELHKRQKYGFPPFYHLLRIYAERANRKSAQAALEKQKEAVQHAYNNVTVLGPAPAFQERTQGKYRWQIILKTKQRSTLVTIAKQLPPNYRHDIDPTRMF